MPGPVLAGTVSRSYSDAHAGAKVTVGHAFIELPLMALVALGIGTLLDADRVMVVIGLLGGSMLLYMGYGMFRQDPDERVEGTEDGRGAVAVGFLTTAANPYFYIWWATVGAALVLSAIEISWLLLPAFALVHLCVDLIWYEGLSISIHRSRDLMGGRGFQMLFWGCGAVMVVFGIYFLYSAISILL